MTEIRYGDTIDVMGKDSTAKKRMAKRRATLNKLAQDAGWKGVSDFETALINGKVQLPPKPKKGGGGE